MNFIMSRQAMWLEAIEKRISATSAMLNSIKGVKMCGLKDTLLASLQQLRVDEMRISKKFRKLIIWNMTFGEHSLSSCDRCVSRLSYRRISSLLPS